MRLVAPLTPKQREALSAAPEGGGAEPRVDALAEFLPGAAAGNEYHLARVVHAVAPAVVSVTRVILGARHRDLDDVAQDSLVEIYRAIGRFRGDSSFLHYARRIAVRCALAARRNARAPESSAVALTELPDSAALAPERLAREQMWSALRTLLDALPAPQAESLALRVVLGQSLGEIAVATGAPINTVRSRIRLAKEEIRARIAENPALAALFEDEA